MLRLYGIPVAPADAMWLVYRLRQVGRHHDLTAAAMIERGVERELYAMGLTVEERDAILGVFDEPPAGLGELRGALARDHRWRSSSG